MTISKKTYGLAQAALMAALGFFLIEKLWSGSLFWYINQRFLPLIVFGAAAALLLAGGALSRWRRRPAEHAHDHGHGHDHAHPSHKVPLWNLIAVALPIALGLLAPARPLGASAVDNRGINVSAPLTAGSAGPAARLDIPSEQRTILDWARAFNYADDPGVFNDQPADVVGFVYHDARLPAGQFMVGRFTITCCAADASAIAMIVQSAQAADLADNTWVRVRGPVRAAEWNGQPVPVILAVSIEPVEQPEHPYMYP